MFVCMYVCMYVRTYVRMYVCMYVCVCIYIYIYTPFAYRQHWHGRDEEPTAVAHAYYTYYMILYSIRLHVIML